MTIIVSKLSKKAIDVPSAQVPVDWQAKGGTIVQIYTRHGAANQRWRFVPDGEGFWKIVSPLKLPKDPNKELVLDVRTGGSENQLPIQIYPYAGGKNQQFKLILVSSNDGEMDFFKIIPRSSLPGDQSVTSDNPSVQMVFDVRDGENGRSANEDDAIIQQYQDLGQDNQLWALMI